MSEIENNAYFWQKVDALFLSSGYVITRKKGTVHPNFPNLIYPMDYGHLNDTKTTSDTEVSVYRGSLPDSKVSALVVSCDILQRELDVKMLIGCNEDDIESVLRFLNQTEYQKTVLIRRGHEIPSWGISDN